MAKNRRAFSGRGKCPAGWACRISPTWDMPAFRSLASPWITGSIISGSPIPASSMPMSCSAARVSSPWQKASRKPCGRWGGAPRRMTPPRNNAGIAHENGAIEGSHGHLKRAIADALLMRSSADFAALAAYRSFIDEIVSRQNARNAKRIDIERAELQALPDRRSSDYEEVSVRVTY